jgi:hypothetical protein
MTALGPQLIALATADNRSVPSGSTEAHLARCPVCGVARPNDLTPPANTKLTQHPSTAPTAGMTSPRR